ncbi:MAG: heavy metal-binding domain-containing protein [Solirubrobacteraceae bacterium]
MSANEPPAEFEETGESPEQQAESLARVERGGIPLAAERRLRELGEQGGAFTSDLSVADFALCHRLGLAPVAQVMGSSIYQVGYQTTPWASGMGVGGSFMFEMEALSQAWNEVRNRALSRLAQEATHVGADAVIGVDLQTGAHDWAENSIEYVVIGTAVRHAANVNPQDQPSGGGHRHSNARSRGGNGGSGEPVLTELSVADYTKLLGAGVEPLGIVAWSSVFFVAASYETQNMGGLGGRMLYSQNQELREFTQGLYEAREIAVGRLTEQAARLDASGVIGVRIAHGIRQMSVGGGAYARSGLIVTFHVIGTAIRESEQTPVYAPEMIVDLTT